MTPAGSRIRSGRRGERVRIRSALKGWLLSQLYITTAATSKVVESDGAKSRVTVSPFAVGRED